MKPKAYSYIRFSTPEQGHGDSERRQREAATEYAENNGLELVLDREYQFLDFGVSAYRGRNSSDEGRLRQFYNCVKDGRITAGSYLIVESLDRLSREDVLTALARFIDLLNEGIKVVTLVDKTVYSKGASPIQLVMSIVYMMRAHDESSTKGFRISAVWQEKQAQARSSGKPLGAACPYWLEYVDGVYVPVMDRVLVIHKIMRMTIDGYGQTAIVKYLNVEKIPVFGSANRNKSGIWGNSSIAKILANRALLGEYQPMTHTSGKRIANGQPIYDYYPAVVNEEIFYAALNARSQRKVDRVTKQSKNFNVWSKLAICSICKSAMHIVNKGNPPKGFKYLRCAAAAKGVCKARFVRIDVADIAFREILVKMNSGTLIKDTDRELKNKISELSGRIIDAERNIVNIESIMAEAPSMALSRTAAMKESELHMLRSNLDVAKMEVAKSIIFNKDDFFQRLDLDTYEGRSAANAFIRNHKRKVWITTNEQGRLFTVTDSEAPFFPKFSVIVAADKSVKFLSFTSESFADIISQGDLTDMLVYRKSIKKSVKKVLKATEGNGREEVRFEYSKLPVFKFSEDDKQKLLTHIQLLRDLDFK